MSEEEESASSLRQKLSDSHAKQAEFAARAAIAEQDLQHIEVEDLKGIKPDEVFEKAASLNEQREQAGKEALVTMLKAQGVEDVDAAVSAVLEGKGGSTPKVDTDAINRARQVGASGGPVRTDDISHLGEDGAAQMRHYFADKNR